MIEVGCFSYCCILLREDFWKVVNFVLCLIIDLRSFELEEWFCVIMGSVVRYGIGVLFVVFVFLVEKVILKIMEFFFVYVVKIWVYVVLSRVWMVVLSDLYFLRIVENGMWDDSVVIWCWFLCFCNGVKIGNWLMISLGVRFF